MCRSQREGGQRCFPSARTKLERAEYAVDEAAARCANIVRESGALNAHHLPDDAKQTYREALGERLTAEDALRAARVEYASTKRGHADLLKRAQEKREEGFQKDATQLERAAEEGTVLRNINYLVSRGHDRAPLVQAGKSRILRTVVSQQAERQREFDTQTRQVAARARQQGYDPDYPDWSGIKPTHVYGSHAPASKGLSIRSEYSVAGVLHRDDGPARVHTNGIREHFRAGKLHNPDGPAMTFPDGVQHWYVHGVRVTQDTHTEWVEAGRPNQTPTQADPAAASR